MPVSSVIIRLSENPQLAHAALKRIAGHDAIDVGLRRGSSVAAVITTEDSEADKHVWHWLQDLAGVSFVDLVFVHFNTDSATRLAAQPPEN